MAEGFPVQSAIRVLDRHAQPLANVMAFSLMLRRFISPLRRRGRRAENWILPITAAHAASCSEPLGVVRERKRFPTNLARDFG